MKIIFAAVLCIGAVALPASVAAAAPAPSVTTSGVSHVMFSSAILNGNVDPRGQTTAYAFQYGTTRAYGAQTPLAAAGNGTITIKVSETVSGLQPATVYHYRVIATSAAGTTKGGDRTFTTAKV